MDSGMENLLRLAVVFGIFILAIFVIPRFLMKRAARQVIRIFMETNSLCSQVPKTVEELGLKKQSFIEGLFRAKDYKPYALRMLVNVGVVRASEDGRLCLLEERVPPEFSSRIKGR